MRTLPPATSATRATTGRARRLAGWLALAASLLLMAAAATAAPGDATLHTDMAAALRQEGLPGAVWASVTPDGGIALGAAGLKHAGSGATMAADTRMHIGSIPKTVLAAGVLRLITEGRLSLDTPVAPLLPTLAFENCWAGTDPVRVRHLLAHTAGLDNLRFWQAFSLEAGADTPLRAAFSRDPSLLAVGTRPGSRYAYSNLGYVLLGMVIEAVTGERYERYLDTHVLQALGMRDSTFGFVSQQGPQADARLAMGHFEHGAMQAAVPSYLRPAGQFTTTAADMAAFMRFLMGDGRLNGAVFVDAALLAAQGLPAATEAALAGLSIGHGLVLAGRDRHGALGFCHPGTSVGFRAMLCVYPDQGKAFFVAINADSETADYERFNVLLMKALALRPAALALPAPLFYTQSFLRLGDFTPASALLAAVTAALPLAMAFGLLKQYWRRGSGAMVALDTAALLAALQCLVVLAAWGMVPFTLWR